MRGQRARSISSIVDAAGLRASPSSTSSSNLPSPRSRFNHDHFHPLVMLRTRFVQHGHVEDRPATSAPSASGLRGRAWAYGGRVVSNIVIKMGVHQIVVRCDCTVGRGR